MALAGHLRISAAIPHAYFGMATRRRMLCEFSVVARPTWSLMVTIGEGESEGGAFPDGCVPLAAMKKILSGPLPLEGIALLDFAATGFGIADDSGRTLSPSCSRGLKVGGLLPVDSGISGLLDAPPGESSLESCTPHTENKC